MQTDLPVTLRHNSGYDLALAAPLNRSSAFKHVISD